MILTPLAFIIGERIDPIIVAAAGRQMLVAVIPLVGVAIAAASVGQVLRTTVGPVGRPELAAAWALGAVGALGSAAMALAMIS